MAEYYDRYRTIKNGFTVFDVAGNHYRIVAVVHYDKQRIYIRQVMTHAEYDRNKWKRS
jgi:mRNA interferase HigB